MKITADQYYNANHPFNSFSCSVCCLYLVLAISDYDDNIHRTFSKITMGVSQGELSEELVT